MSAEPIEIVLVEDDPDHVELTLRALDRHNLANRVHVARDGAEALAYLLPDNSDAEPVPPPRLVLLDLMLPKVDGLDVLRRLKASPATRAIPVVVLSSSREEADLVRSYQLGVNSYVTKPIRFEEFMEAVGNLGLYWVLLNEIPD